MAELKTKQTNASVHDFIMAFADSEQKQKDSFDLVKIMEEESGDRASVWGTSIIGFGKYHYKSERSTQQGDWPLIGFSPRKAAISLYVYTGSKKHEYLLENLGKFKIAKACIYIKKLQDIDQKHLRLMIRETIKYLQEKYN